MARFELTVYAPPRPPATPTGDPFASSSPRDPGDPPSPTSFTYASPPAAVRRTRKGGHARRNAVLLLIGGAVVVLFLANLPRSGFPAGVGPAIESSPTMGPAARIVLGKPGPFGYDNYTEDGSHGYQSRLYFDLPMTNADTVSHDTTVFFRVHLTAAGWGTDDGKPTDLDFDWTADFSLDPGTSVQKVVWGPVWPHHTDTLSNADLSLAKVSTIDGVATTDPGDVLDQISVSARFTSPALTVSGSHASYGWCAVTITNHDTLPHTISGHLDYAYTYLSLGDALSDSSSMELFNYTTTTVPAGATITIGGEGGNTAMGLDGLPEEITSITTQGVQLTLADPGGSGTRTFASDGCDYQK